MPDEDPLAKLRAAVLRRLAPRPVPPAVDPRLEGPQQALPMPEQSSLTGWRQTADEGLNALVGAFKGVTGLGDQGPAGPTWTNAGALAGTLIPFGPKGLRAAKTEASAAVRPALDGVAKAKQLYIDRGHVESGSIVGMAQALRDAGVKLPPTRTMAERRAANAYVEQLIGETKAQGRMATDSPFTRPRDE